MNTKSLVSSIKKPIFQTSMLVLFVLILAACQASGTTSGKAPAAHVVPAPTIVSASSTQAPVVAFTEPTINVATDPKLGKILVDGKGMTLYMYTVDGPNQSNCSGGCLQKWPALLTQGSPKLGAGVDASMIGTAKLADGTLIVTYNKMPLYYWVKDTKPGDTTGQNVGTVWFVVSPDGKKVDGSAAAPAVVAFTEPTINVATDPKLGKILVDGKGMTLYMYTVDGPNQSNCSGGCLQKWPALLTQGKPNLGPGVDDSLIGTAKLADGTLIVTYNKMPLYYWVKDTKAGDTTGQGVGSVWYVVSPDGKVVDGSAAAPAIVAFTEPTINVATDPKLGKILVDGKGMTLYMFTKDGPNQSNCTGGCLAKWPPLLTQGSPKLGVGVDDSKIGTAKLADGTMIVTYNKMPLYYWVKDTKPGDTTGEGVGSVWYVVSPDGNKVEEAGEDNPTATPAVVGFTEPTINVATDPKLGKILVDGMGMTLYMYTVDGPNQSNCTGGCLQKWPPLLTQGKPNLGPGVDGSLIGTAKLADGTLIVTYNKMPLYYWVKDTKAGDTTGQGVGSVWYVVSPDGKIVGK